MRTGEPEHLKGFSYVGIHRYSLTFCTNNRAKTFIAPPAVHLVLAQTSRAADENGFAIIAYCFMPDHIHLLVEGRSDASGWRQFIARAKQYSGFYYSKTFGAKLWQRYSFEHVLRDEQKSVVVARYILMNPVRAGLVKRIDEYRYAGSLVWPMPGLVGLDCEEVTSGPGPPKGGHYR